jgi:hypothetical protein
MREDADAEYVPPAARLGVQDLMSAAKRSTETTFIMISHLSDDNHLKLNVQPRGDGWIITPWPVYQDSRRPLHAEQSTGQFATYTRLVLTSIGSVSLPQQWW